MEEAEFFTHAQAAFKYPTAFTFEDRLDEPTTMRQVIALLRGIAWYRPECGRVADVLGREFSAPSAHAPDTPRSETEQKTRNPRTGT